MITEQDLQEAIAECQGERHPNASTCMKLAAFYVIRNEMFPTQPQAGYSFAPPPAEVEKTIIDYSSDTEFGQGIEGKDPAKIWPIVDELSEAVKVLMPRLYADFMRKLRS